MRKVILNKTQASHADDMLGALERLAKQTIGMAFGAINISSLPTKLTHTGKSLGFTLTTVLPLSPSVASALNAAVGTFRLKLGASAIIRLKSKDSTYIFELEETTKSFDILLENVRDLTDRMSSNIGALNELSAERLTRVKNIEIFEKLIAEARSNQKALFSYLRQL